MTPSATFGSPVLQRLRQGMGAVLAFATLSACASHPTTPRAEITERDAEAADAGGDSAMTALEAGPIDAATAGGPLAPTLTEVSGRTVEVVEGGAGAATVVFEAGLGNDWTPWDQVAQQVAARARVFAYSRPGYGHSEASTAPRTAPRIVEDLRALLAAQHLAPPYVLVGHSFGGAYMELFAKAHPEEVVGLVLVDPRHRDFTAACEHAGFDGCTIPASVVATLPEVQQAEIEAFAQVSTEIRAAGSFGAYPVRVLTATEHGFAPEVEGLWESLLGSLAREAIEGKQIVFKGAGHLLQVQRPEEVADAILSLLPSSRN